jgi:hypothetical protein
VKEQSEDLHSRAELCADGVANGALEKSPEARGLSQIMRDPARRKRDAGHKTKDRCRTSANGHGRESSSLIEHKGQEANGKRNGTGDPVRRGSEFVLTNAELNDVAASDDASGTTFAEDAGLPSTAVCIGREACAEVAAPRSASLVSQTLAGDEESGTDDDRRPRACGDLKKMKTVTSAKNEGASKEYPPGIDEPLALDAPGFVDEMHARVNLYEVYKDLLTSPDLKIKQRAAESLLEMKYGKGASIAIEEAPRIDFGDLPRPQR